MSLDSVVQLCWTLCVSTERSIDKVDDDDGVVFHHVTAVLHYGSASFSLAAIYALSTFYCGVLSVD